MAGRQRTRRGIPKPSCRYITFIPTRGTHEPCKDIPRAGWDFCPTHHDREVAQLAVTWEQQLPADGTPGTLATVQVALPNLDKPLNALTREEEAALGRLIVFQHYDHELPAPTENT